MTIAACYISREGVVLGADSTTTYGAANGNHYYNHGQKLFEIGEGSNFGIVTWGMGGLPHVSYRTLIARLGDDLVANPPVTVEEVANRWASLFWTTYQLSDGVLLFGILHQKTPYDQSANNPPATARTADEEKRYQHLAKNLVVGFCIGGCSPSDRTPAAFEMIFEGSLTAAPQPAAVPEMGFWGAPNFMSRLIFGVDFAVRDNLLNSGKWTGTSQEFDAIVNQHRLSIFTLPLREAVDFVFSSIRTTIKALKFSSLSQICGGPIEVAVITSDRNFRWVRHKPWDSAINEGDIE